MKKEKEFEDLRALLHKMETVSPDVTLRVYITPYQDWINLRWCFTYGVEEYGYSRMWAGTSPLYLELDSARRAINEIITQHNDQNHDNIQDHNQ